MQMSNPQAFCLGMSTVALVFALALRKKKLN